MTKRANIGSGLDRRQVLKTGAAVGAAALLPEIALAEPTRRAAAARCASPCRTIRPRSIR